MSNPFYAHATDIVPFTRARAEAVDSHFDSLLTSFNAVYAYVQRTARGPAGEVLNDLPNAATRANKSFVFDSSGHPAVTVSASSAEMQAAIAAASAAAASAAAASADATSILATLYAVCATLAEVSGTSENAAAGTHYFLTNAGATTIVLPPSPTAGDTVWASPVNGRADNVLDPGSQKIGGASGTRTTDMGLSTYQLRFLDATRGWWLL